MNLLTDASSDIAGLPIDGATIWCPNRGIMAAVEGRAAWRSPELPAAADGYERLWQGIVEAIEPLTLACQSLEADAEQFRPIVSILPTQAVAMFECVGTKAVGLDAWLRETDGQPRAVCGPAYLTPVDGIQGKFGIADNIWAALADAGELQVDRPNRTKAPSVPDEQQMLPPPTLLDRTFNIVNRPAPAFLFQLWRKLGAPELRVGPTTVAIADPNEMIEESFLRLLRKRHSVVRLAFPKLQRLQPQPVPADFIERLRQIWVEVCDDVLSDSLREAGWALLRDRFERVAARVPDAAEQARRWRDATAHFRPEHRSNTVVLSNGLYGPAERVVDAILREARIPVICTDHGIGVGIGARHTPRAQLVTQFADVYVTHNAKTAEIYSAARTRAEQAYPIGGTPSVLRRARWRSLQRRVYRRHLGLARGQRMLMYVTSLCANTLHQGWGTSTDTAYQDFQAELIVRLRRFPDRVTVKPYPAHRYVDPEPVWQLTQDDVVRLAPTGEFRQQRWAADVLLLDLGSSTLGWALATDIPLIYVDNVSNPLADEARSALGESVFLVDAQERGWQEALDSLLSMPADAMAERWAAMKPRRLRFCEEFGLGPDLPLGSSVADAVDLCVRPTSRLPLNPVGVAK